jgi:hypothetical protein
MSKRRYKRIPGTNLAIVLPRQPRPLSQEIVVSAARPPAIQVTHTDYRPIESDGELQIRFLTALFNFLSPRR